MAGKPTFRVDWFIIVPLAVAACEVAAATAAVYWLW